jgi:hypothetical protein
MARFPDGWVFTVNASGPKVNDDKPCVNVSVDQRELVMCRHCRFSQTIGRGELFCIWTNHYVEPQGYCSEAERGEE